MKQKLYFLVALFGCLLSSGQTTTLPYHKGAAMTAGSGLTTTLSNFSTCQSSVSATFSAIGFSGSWSNGNFDYYVNNVLIGTGVGTQTFDISAYIPVNSVKIVKTNYNNWNEVNITVNVSSPTSSMPATGPTVSNITYVQNATASPLTATLNSTGTSLKWYTSVNGDNYTTTAPTPSTATLGTTSYWVAQATASGCESVRSKIDVNVVQFLPATHLNFDGANDFVNIGNPITSGNSYTMEAMINTNNITGSNILSSTTSAFWFWQGNIQAGHGGGFMNVYANASSLVNSWNHVAVTYDAATTTMKLYINGVLVSQNASVPQYSGANIQIGAFYSGSVYNGSMDEVRIWNVARTADQILGSKNCELQGTETGLVSYYKFNQGNDATDNTTITSLTDATANANNGTLTNFALTGSTSNFLAGSPITTGVVVPSSPTVTTPVTYYVGDSATELTATTGGTGLLWYTTATGGTGSATAPIPSTATAGSTSYWVSSTNANGCESARAEIVVTINTYATHLNFDGANDFVNIGSPINTGSSYTKEAMIYTQNITGSNILSSNTSAFWFWQGNIQAGHGGGFMNVYANASSLVNSWNHVALTYDAPTTTMKLYINGILVSQNTSVPQYTAANIQIGAFNSGSVYNGSMDEVRIWNVVRTADQILGSKNCELQGNETGLVSYYKFNQGNGAADNTTITTLTDATANANNGTLTNFALTGSTSNFLAGSPITTGVVVPSTPTVTTPVVYNQGDTATELTATTGGTGLLWYTTATGGTGNTTTPIPSTTAGGVTSYWVSSTNANGCESARAEIVVTVTEPATHLNFDGTNDFVSVPNHTSLAFGTSDITLEAMVKTNFSQSNWAGIITKMNADPSSSKGLQLLVVNNKLALEFGSNPTVLGTGNGLIGTTNLNDNIWHHVACVVNRANNNIKLYVDGIVEANVTNTAIGTLDVTTATSLFIGKERNSSSFLKSNIDEVRIWNVARTAEQISGSKNCELQGTETGLLAYYKFNQGNSAINNSTITTLTDATANANNGTLTNFALTGTTSNWLAGSSITTGIVVPSTPTVTTPVIYNQGDSATELTATTGGTGLLWYTTATGGTGNTTLTPSTATAGSTSYWVSSTNANGCESARAEIVVIVNAPATHLNFDGVNDYVSINTPYTAFTNKISVEFWVKRNGTINMGSGLGQSGNTDSMSTNVWQMHGNTNNTFDFVVNQGGTWLSSGPCAIIPDNTWTHIAGVADNSGVKIYVNGVLSNSNAIGITSSVLSNPTAHLHIGKDTRYATSTGRVFKGDIDEVRVWNIALTATDITNTMNCEAQAQPELVAYYKFNQGFNQTTNSTITTATDSAGTNNGTLNGFALTGATSNWAAGSPIATGTTCTVLENESFDVSSNFKIYPNPATNNVNIDLLDLENANVEVYDINGRQLFSQKLSNTQNTINIENLAAGIYMFKVSSSKGSATSKVIKR